MADEITGLKGITVESVSMFLPKPSTFAGLGVAPMTMQITVAVMCSRCNAAAPADPHVVMTGTSIMVEVPPGWVEHDGGLLCDRHRVAVVDVDP